MRRNILAATLAALAVILIAAVAHAQEAPKTVALLVDNDVDALIAVTLDSAISGQPHNVHTLDVRHHDPSRAREFDCLLGIGANGRGNAIAWQTSQSQMVNGFTGTNRWDTAEMAATVVRFIDRQCPA